MSTEYKNPNAYKLKRRGKKILLQREIHEKIHTDKYQRYIISKTANITRKTRRPARLKRISRPIIFHFSKKVNILKNNNGENLLWEQHQTILDRK